MRYVASLLLMLTPGLTPGLGVLGFAALAIPAAAQSADDRPNVYGVFLAYKNQRFRFIDAVAVHADDGSRLTAMVAERLKNKLPEMDVWTKAGAKTLLVVRTSINGVRVYHRMPLPVAGAFNVMGRQARYGIAKYPLRKQDNSPRKLDPGIPANVGAIMRLKVLNVAPGDSRPGTQYELHVHIEQPGRPPLWVASAVAFGKSVDPDALFRSMADKLVSTFGRTASRVTFSHD